MLTYTFLAEPTPDQINDITTMYRMESWWTKKENDPELVARIVAGSHCFLVVEMDGAAIGMGRAISDGASDAYIQDVTVKKEYRRRGIGRQIIRRLIERLHADGLDWIGLIAENDSAPFYEPLGFKKMPRSVPMLNLKK